MTWISTPVNIIEMGHVSLVVSPHMGVMVIVACASIVSVKKWMLKHTKDLYLAIKVKFIFHMTLLLCE